MKRLKTTCAISFIFTALQGCGGSSSSESSASVDQLVAEFDGIATLERSGDNSWVARWKPIDLNGVVYAVFTADEGAEFNFDQPVVTTQEDVYKFTPTNIFAEVATCFSVRIANFNGDSNTTSLCSEVTQFTFNGVKSIERQSDGAYILQWDGIPVTGTIFSIYESRNDEPFNFKLPSFDAIKDNFFKTAVVERGDKACFVVRYYHADLPADENTTKICTEDEVPIQFAGISGLTAKSSSVVNVAWQASSSPGIVGYRIYQGSDFKELMAEVSASVTNKDITGLVPGRQYNFGVRAVDQYQREDKNIRIRPVILPTD